MQQRVEDELPLESQQRQEGVVSFNLTGVFPRDTQSNNAGYFRGKYNMDMSARTQLQKVKIRTEKSHTNQQTPSLCLSVCLSRLNRIKKCILHFLKHNYQGNIKSIKSQA